MDSWSDQGAKESSTMVTPSTGNGLRREGKTDLQAARTVPETHKWSGYFNATKNVEASGYALLAYLALGQFSDAFPITQWLLSKQNSNGGFESTQVCCLS
jgi:A-macroglobulin TED domain